MRYQEIRDNLKTGDVILFSGKGNISDGIKFFSLSKWSHVGMVYRFETATDPKGSLFCWESTTLCDVADAETGKLTRGVQRVELSERLERCLANGYEISIRPLNRRLPDAMVSRLDKFRHEVSGRPYELKKLELIRSLWDGPFGQNKEDLSSLFCSELLAEAYQRIGLLSEERPSNEYIPKDFSDEKKLTLLDDFYLAKEIAVNSL